MRLFILIALIIFILSALSGCAGKPKRKGPETQEFVTEIKDDGSKRFLLTLVSRGDNRSRGENSGRSKGKEGGRGGNKGGGRSPRGQRDKQSSGAEQYPQGNASREGSADDDTEEKAMSLLEAKLAETKYCRNGYILLEYSQIKGETFVRGECQESASKDDRSRWD